MIDLCLFVLLLFALVGGIYVWFVVSFNSVGYF